MVSASAKVMVRPPNFGGENPQKSQKDEKKIGGLFLELPGKWGANISTYLYLLSV
jgi:hypothetical protein